LIIQIFVITYLLATYNKMTIFANLNKMLIFYIVSLNSMKA